MSKKKAQELGIKSLVTIKGYNTSGLKPELVMEAPIPGIKTLLKKHKLNMDDFDLVEHNEAFSSASIAVMKGFDIPKEKFNVHGGAVAIGHPIGSSGSRILVTLMHAMDRMKKDRGLASIYLGDSIQTLKAGIMEIADIYVVNKADRYGVEQTVAEVQSLVEIVCSSKKRKTPIIQTIAKESKHIDKLAMVIEEHKSYLEKSNKLDQQRKMRYEAELVEIIRKKLMNFIFNEEQFKKTIEDLLIQINKKEIDPHTASEIILKDIMKQ